MFLFWVDTEAEVLLEGVLAALDLLVDADEELAELDLLVEADEDELLEVEDPLEVRDCALSSVCGAAMAIAMKLAAKMVANFFMVLSLNC